MINELIKEAQELSDQGSEANEDIKKINAVFTHFGDRLHPVQHKQWENRLQAAKKRLSNIIEELEFKTGFIDYLIDDSGKTQH